MFMTDQSRWSEGRGATSDSNTGVRAPSPSNRHRAGQRDVDVNVTLVFSLLHRSPKNHKQQVILKREV